MYGLSEWGIEKSGLIVNDAQIRRIITEEYYDNERKKYNEFYVEFEPFRVFYRAEEYHQNYLEKHPNGYCHITKKEMEEVGKLN